MGQKIAYTTARTLRGRLYQQYGTAFTPAQLVDADLTWLGPTPATIIRAVTVHIITQGVNLDSEAGIRSLAVVPGIGPWTVDTTLLTCLKSWDIFPTGDTFLRNRMRRLYGTNVDMTAVSARWAPYRSVVTWMLWRWF